VRTLVAEILEAWRRAERLVAELTPGTPEHAAAMLAIDRLRNLYGDMAKALPELSRAEAEAQLRELRLDEA
jgi:hypothetical protein